MTLVNKLLPKVKANLILAHNEDDELLRGYIRAAVGYAEGYQKKTLKGTLPPATEHAIIILSSHFYESRDSSTGGFFGDNVGAAAQVWQTVHRLLAIEKGWEF